MRRALLVVHSSTFFPRMLDVGRMLKKSGRYEPLFFLAGGHLCIARDLEVLRADELSYVSPMGDPTAPPQSGSPADGNRPVWQRLVKRVLGCLPEPVGQRVKVWGSGVLTVPRDNVLYHLWSLTRQLRFVTHLIRREKASILVLALDIAQYDTAVFINAAHREHIPALIVPASVSDASDEWGDLYMHEPVCSIRRWSNRLLGALYPHWVKEHKGRKVVMLPAANQALAREWLGLAPPSPWIAQSGYADAIAVEGEMMRQFGISAGLPPDKLFVTGAAAHDGMAEALKDASRRRAALYRRLDLPPGRPMLLTALPQAYFGEGRIRPNQEFHNYAELVQFWVQSLAAVEGYNVVISLHPSVNYEDMAYVEQWGVKIARQRTPDLIPLCDIYVATCCSTIPWAIACGKPVINYDMGRYRIPDYELAGGMITIEEKDEFLTVLSCLTTDSKFYTGIAARQATCASQWGLLDGRSGQRILQLIDQLVEWYEK